MLESSQEAFEGVGFLCRFKANSYRIIGRPWSSRNNLFMTYMCFVYEIEKLRNFINTKQKEKRNDSLDPVTTK